MISYAGHKRRPVFSAVRHGLHRLPWLISLTCLGAVFSSIELSPANASSSTPAPLPVEAQDAIKKGILAAKGQDYTLAVRFFQDARKIAPDAPEVFYDLGLAESKIPGRELRAIAWFGAYLAVDPKAPNAGAVKDQIDVLDVKGLSNLSRVISSVQAQAPQTANPESHLARVAGLWAQAGDMTAAFKTVDLLQDANSRTEAQINIAEVQENSGDRANAQRTLVAAQRTADLIPTSVSDYQSQDYDRIAEAQVKVIDLVGAQKTAALIRQAYLRCQALLFIAEEQIKDSDFTGANHNLAAAETASDLIGSGGMADMNSEYKAKIARAKIRIGDLAGARLTLNHARALADSMPTNSSTEASLKSFNLEEIFYLQAEAGDFEGARQTLTAALRLPALITEEQSKKNHLDSLTRDPMGRLHNVVTERVATGDFVGAQITVDLVENPGSKSCLQKEIAEAQAIGGDLAGAKRTAQAIAMDQGFCGRVESQKAIAEAHSELDSINHSDSAPTAAVKPPVQPAVPAITSSDWLRKLDEASNYADCPLDTDPFLDLAGYLRTLPSSGDPEKIFSSLADVAAKIAKAQSVIDAMLKQQAQQQAAK